jgi:hypothetical protein
LPAPIAARPSDPHWIDYALLLCLAAVLLLTNPWFGLIDDEAFQVGAAAQPIGIVVTQFRTDVAQQHPPLPDIMLHYWLVLTGDSLFLLRVPSICFFVLGIWVCSCIANEVAGAGAATATIVLGALWPYGFHFGRYAVWNSFGFFLVACITYAYLRWLERPTRARLFWCVVLAMALLFTNYMSWAFLAALAADFLFRAERGSRAHRTQLAIAGGILIVGYAPVWPVFIQLFKGLNPAVSLTTLYTFLYSLYVLFASESIAPWVLGLSIPLALCIVGCCVIILLKGPRFARLLGVYTLVLALALTLTGAINEKRVMPLGAWLLTAAGIALGATSQRWRRWLIIGFTVIGCISWLGIVSRRYYSTARYFEPWQQIAHAATTSVLSGETVIGSHPAFFFYLTREVMKAEGFSARDFKGNYGEQVQRPGVYHVTDWNLAKHPTSPRVLFVATLYGTDFDDTIAAAAWLDQHCAREKTDKLVENPQYQLKERLFGPAQGSPWRIEVSRYACGSQQSAP